MAADLIIQIVHEALDVFKKCSLLDPLQAFIETNMWFSPTVKQMNVQLQRFDGYRLLKEQVALFEAGRPPLEPDAVDSTV